jgi:hypothetical protein
VGPGVRETLANLFCMVRVLIELDLPALDLPAKITSKPSSGGQPFKEGHESRNLAWW